MTPRPPRVSGSQKYIELGWWPKNVPPPVCCCKNRTCEAHRNKVCGNIAEWFLISSDQKERLVCNDCLNAAYDSVRRRRSQTNK